MVESFEITASKIEYLTPAAVYLRHHGLGEI